MEKNYLQTATQGSWWNYIQYLFSIGTSFVLSIVLIRYIPTSTYGVYTYVIFVSGALVLAMNFGLTTTIQTYIPPLHFTQKLDERNRTFRQLLKIQLLIVTGSLILLLPLASQWHRLTSFQVHNFGLLIGIAILIAAVSVCINFFSTLLNSLQRFKTFAQISIISQLLGIVAVLLMVFLHQQILFILLFGLGINLTILLRYFWLSRDLWENIKAIITERIVTKKMFSFSFLAYINILLQLVIWDRSEFFFLGKFQSSEQLAIYGVAYTASLMLVGLLDPVMGVFVSILSELVGKNDWKRIQLIIEKTSKYAGIVLLPVVTILLFYSALPISFLYGKQFLSVSIILPWLAFSALISRAFIPAWALTTYKHDLGTIVKIELGIAAINVFLDVLLIPRFGFIGAAWANCLTQTIAVIAIAVFIRKYGLQLHRSSFARLLILNGLILGLLFVVRMSGITGWTFFAIFIGVAIAYLYIIVKFFMHTDDLVFLSDVEQHSPTVFRPFIRVFAGSVQRLKLYVDHT